MRSVVYREPGRFAGWPANYGMWHWGEEVVLIFAAGWVGADTGLHPRDKSRPFLPMVARSRDGGSNWTEEPFTGVVPGGVETLSGDEHVDPPLQIGPRLSDDDFVPVPDGVDFADPETIVLCGRTGITVGSRSWFYLSRDRARSWSGPHVIPQLGSTAVSARTDVIPLGGAEALFQLTVGKSDGTEGRILTAWTGDGGRSFERRSWVGEEPDGWAIMPSSTTLADRTIVTARRCAGHDHDHQWVHWIDLYASADQGRSWHRRGTPVAATGSGGNPPALIRVGDGRLVLVYGSRAEPYGLRSAVSADDGHSWTASVITDDVADRDMGYPRAVAMEDGSVLAVFYANSSARSERHIEAVRWTP